MNPIPNKTKTGFHTALAVISLTLLLCSCAQLKEFLGLSSPKIPSPQLARLELRLIEEAEGGSIPGTMISKAWIKKDKASDQSFVSITFSAEGAQEIQRISSENIGKQLGIYLDGRLISSPTIQASIDDGRAIIQGLSVEELNSLKAE